MFVVDDRVPRSPWPLGRVTRVRRNSTDGHVRNVTVKTRTALYDRPVDKIVLLESISVEMSEVSNINELNSICVYTSLSILFFSQTRSPKVTDLRPKCQNSAADLSVSFQIND